MQHCLLQKGHFQILNYQVKPLLDKSISLRHFNTFDRFALFHVVHISWVVCRKKEAQPYNELAVFHHQYVSLGWEIQAFKPKSIRWREIKKHLALWSECSDISRVKITIAWFFLSENRHLNDSFWADVSLRESSLGAKASCWGKEFQWMGWGRNLWSWIDCESRFCVVQPFWGSLGLKWASFC